MTKSGLTKIFIFGLAVVVTAAIVPESLCSEVGNNKCVDANSAQAMSRPKPTIIWFHSVSTGNIESLKYVLSSGLVTHVMVLYMHRTDADWKTNADVRKAIEMVKKSDAKLIWCRDIWPCYANEKIKLADFFDPNYYIREVNYLRSEGKQMEADFVALDIEPYGYSPMKRYMKSKDYLTFRQRALLHQVIQDAIKRVGKVDFVLPAGAMDLRHPYNILSGLG